MIYYLQQVLDDVARNPVGPEDEEDAREPLPAPMFKVCFFCFFVFFLLRPELDGTVWAGGASLLACL